MIKIIASIISFITVFCILSCDKSKVIIHPEFDTNSIKSSNYGIDRIELNDTSTIIDMTLYHLPDFWVRITSPTKLRGTTSEKEYPLKFIEGLAPDIMVHVDSTGFLKARLFFDPIDASDSAVDLYMEGQYLYNGIKLYEDTVGKIKTTLTGTLDAMGASWLIVKVNNPEASHKYYIMPVRDGKFNYDIFTDQPLVCEVFIGKEYLEYFLEGFPEFWSEGGVINLDFEG